MDSGRAQTAAARGDDAITQRLKRALVVAVADGTGDVVRHGRQDGVDAHGRIAEERAVGGVLARAIEDGAAGYTRAADGRVRVRARGKGNRRAEQRRKDDIARI